MDLDARRVGFERMYRAHYRPVLSYARRRTSIDAEDVVAETFLVAWRRFDDLPRDPLPWLLGVARRVLATQRRTARRRDALLQRAIREASVVQDVLASDTVLLDRPVLEALARLSERDREALMLVAWDGLDHQQAAAVLGCTSLAFRVRIHRARRRLREELRSLDDRSVSLDAKSLATLPEHDSARSRVEKP